ncbi:hypothetical protein HYS28_01030 [Candidatus Uhrbacteria bacterium]|nr:hypothetical protein [Candidatus Uhrbacteria bacterium]
MKFDMKLNTFADPFFRTVAHAFLGSVCGLVGGIVIGALIGVIARYGIEGYGEFGSFISIGSMSTGAVLGAIFGGIVGIVRKD